MVYRYRKKNPSKTKYIMAVLLIAVVAGVAWIILGGMQTPIEKPLMPYCGDGTCQDYEGCSTCPQDCGQCPQPPQPSDGRLAVAMKDDKIKLFGGNELLQLNLTVKSVQVISYISNNSDANVTANGWMTIFNGSRIFNLLDFAGTPRQWSGKETFRPGNICR